jgi:hypothetical protein
VINFFYFEKSNLRKAWINAVCQQEFATFAKSKFEKKKKKKKTHWF